MFWQPGPLHGSTHQLRQRSDLRSLLPGSFQPRVHGGLKQREIATIQVRLRTHSSIFSNSFCIIWPYNDNLLYVWFCVHTVQLYDMVFNGFHHVARVLSYWAHPLKRGHSAPFEALCVWGAWSFLVGSLLDFWTSLDLWPFAEPSFSAHVCHTSSESSAQSSVNCHIDFNVASTWRSCGTTLACSHPLQVLPSGIVQSGIQLSSCLAHFPSGRVQKLDVIGK